MSSELIKIGNKVLAILNFVFWLYQISKSLLDYIRYDPSKTKEQITIHIILFAANIFYLLFEIQLDHYIPFYLTLVLLLDLSSVYSFYLIS